MTDLVSLLTTKDIDIMIIGRVTGVTGAMPGLERGRRVFIVAILLVLVLHLHDLQWVFPLFYIQ